MTSDQQAFLDVPRSRNSWREGRLVRDPETSFSAARSVSGERITALQRAIMNVLRLSGPLTDEELVRRLRSGFSRKDTDSSIRSRRAELVRRGLVCATDEQGITATGRACTKWAVV